MMQLLGDTTLLLQCRSHQVWRVPLNQATDSIPVGESKTFYCGTRDEGLLVLKPESQQIWQFKHKPGEGQFTIPGNLVNELYCDKFGNVMMGIVDHGLVSLDEVFMRTYTQQGAGFGKGPIGGSIMSLCAEGDHIWIGTYYGLFSYDPAANQFIAYNQQDGALPNEYIRTSSLLTDKHLYMGGVKGMVQIAYNHAVPEKDAPSFDIAECTLDGQIVGNPFYHAKKELVLPYENNFFLRVMTTEKSRFRIREYRFLIPEYTKIPIERPGAELRLYKLDAGSYTVQVSCTLNDGSWSPFQELVKFKVSAPWYRSGWFITVITLLTLLIVGGIVSFVFYQKQQRLKQELAQNRRRINEEKIDFLVNVSHELRTPLTLIYAPLNRMLQRTKPDAWNYRMLLTACRQSAHIMP